MTTDSIIPEDKGEYTIYCYCTGKAKKMRYLDDEYLDDRYDCEYCYREIEVFKKVKE